jgi:pilus assembly protein Flp/PilA
MLTQYYLYVKNWIEAQLRPEEGQDLAEYAIMLGIIALAVIAIIIAIGGKVQGVFSAFNASFQAS